MPRLLLTDEYWPKLKLIMLEAGIYDKPGLRLTVEGILYRLRVGCPWRDLPESFGPWNRVFKRFNDWSAKGKLLLLTTIRNYRFLNHGKLSQVSLVDLAPRNFKIYRSIAS